MALTILLYFPAVFYSLIKLYARLAIKIYCRKIIINKPHHLNTTGPLLLAANHPNSFLDGVIMTTLFKEGVYSLARGDAFKKERINKLLRSIYLLPVYRTSEGVENLTHNYITFETCQEVFSKDGIVMIFSEGRCINEWHLRPLKKGTARLAISTWQKGIDLNVIPVGFNYSPFRVFGKNVHINFGEPIIKTDVATELPEGKQLLAFNGLLEEQLKGLVYEIDKGDKKLLKQKLYQPQPLLKRRVLFIPAAVGFLLHAPLYFTAKKVTDKHFDNDHYDSVINALLMLAYPLYLILFFILAGAVFNWWIGLCVFVLMPFCAWAYVRVKDQKFG